jgi:hypothetical protein
MIYFWFFFIILFFTFVALCLIFSCSNTLFFFVSLISIKLNFLHYTWVYFEHIRSEVNYSSPYVKSRISGSQKYKHMVIRKKPNKPFTLLFNFRLSSLLSCVFLNKKYPLVKKNNSLLRKPLLKSRKPWWMSEREFNKKLLIKEFESKGGGYYLYAFGIYLQENFSVFSTYIILSFLFAIFCFSSILSIYHIYKFLLYVAVFFP